MKGWFLIKKHYKKRDRVRTNRYIRVPEVRLIAGNGEQLGIKPTSEALKIAEDSGLDLVEIAPNAKPPVARIMDYSKYRYEQEQKAKLARKHATVIEIKEIKMRLKIDVGDYNTKKKHVLRFLKSGAKVKVTIMFRGREMVHKELGLNLLNKLAEDVAEYGMVESPPKQDGRNMVMVLVSTGKKDKEETNGVKKAKKTVESDEQ